MLGTEEEFSKMLYKDKSLQIVVTCISLIQIKVPVLFVFKCSSDSLRLNTYGLVYNISDDGFDCSGDCMFVYCAHNI